MCIHHLQETKLNAVAVNMIKNFCLIALATLLAAAPVFADPAPKQMKLFLLLGQSNSNNNAPSTCNSPPQRKKSPCAALFLRKAWGKRPSTSTPRTSARLANATPPSIWRIESLN